VDPDDDDDLPWGHEGYEVSICVDHVDHCVD